MSRAFLMVESWESLAKDARFRPAELAVLARRSLRQLERFFQNQYRETPRVWLRKFQCQLAAEMLAEGCSNKEIVADLYFADQTQFCHAFKKIYHVTPNSYLLGRAASKNGSPSRKHVARRQ
jgi:AraC-like DNA-binding protein